MCIVSSSTNAVLCMVVYCDKVRCYYLHDVMFIFMFKCFVNYFIFVMVLH
ncbi:hypothetical protein [Lactococcus phage PMBT68]|nr:hypothetical protein [Lactococcus phage P1411]